MAFRNAHVEKAFRKLLGKGKQPCSVRHGSRNGRDALIFFCQRTEHFAHSVTESRLCRAEFTGYRIEGTDPVKQIRVCLCVIVTLALLRNDVQQHGGTDFLCQADSPFQLADVVPVNRPEIIQPQRRKHVAGKEALFDLLLDAVAGTVELGIDADDGTVPLFKTVIALAQAQPVQHAGHAAHIAADGHGIVIENDHNRFQAG